MRTLKRLLNITHYLITNRGTLLAGKVEGIDFQQCLADLIHEIDRVGDEVHEDKPRDSTGNSQQTRRAALLQRSRRILLTKLRPYREIVHIYHANKTRNPAASVGESLLKSHEQDLLRLEKISREIIHDTGDIGEAEKALSCERDSDDEDKQHVLQCKCAAPGKCIVGLGDIECECATLKCIVDLRDNLAIGSGGSSEVFLVGWGRRHAAAKVLTTGSVGGGLLDTDNGTKHREFVRELDLLKKMRDASHVVQLYGFCSKKSGTAGVQQDVIVMEFMVNGSLFSFLAKHRAEGEEELEPRVRRRLRREVALGMWALHDKELVHKDLKAENVLLDGRLRAKVSDFGLSKPLNADSTVSPNQTKVTWRALAPEAIPEGNKDLRGQPADVYAYGILLWEMVTLRVAWKEELGSEEWRDRKLDFFQEEVVKSRSRPEIPKRVDNGERSIMQRCWRHAPEDRPVFVGILAEWKVQATMHGLSAAYEGGTQRSGLWGYLPFWKTVMHRPESTVESVGLRTEENADSYDEIATTAQDNAPADPRTLLMLESRMELEGAMEALSTEKKARQEAEKKAPTITPLHDMAKVPAAALLLPKSYVKRTSLLSKVVAGLTATDDVGDAVDEPTSPGKALAPFTVVGMGGEGKTVLASAAVRELSVREYFRGGIFWVNAQRGAKNNLLPLLLGLAREMGPAPTDPPDGTPYNLDSLEQVQRRLAALASTGIFPRLVVLDNVWEREVVDAFLPLKLKVLVTTRDDSVVGVPGDCLTVEDMSPEEALELLRLASSAMGQPGRDVRTQMEKVVARCGCVPMVLAIAGSMTVVEGKGLIPGAWVQLMKDFEDVAEKMDAIGEESESLNLVLGTSFNALAKKSKKEFLNMAVLAAGALAPIAMLRNLWDIEDLEGARDAAKTLVSGSLLQDVGGDRYRVHDLLLEFLKIKITTYCSDMVTVATSRQAQYLGRLDVVVGYNTPDHGAGHQGLFLLDALWRSVEKLSGNQTLEVDSYRVSLSELDSCEVTEDGTVYVVTSYSSIGHLYFLQGKYAAAEQLFETNQVVLQYHRGPESLLVAPTLGNLAACMQKQGRFEEAEVLHERCLAIFTEALGPTHITVARTLDSLVGVLLEQDKISEAESALKRAAGIFAVTVGSYPLSFASHLNTRAQCLKAQGNISDAGPLYQQVVEIYDKALGRNHPDVAIALNNQASLLHMQGNDDEAWRLYERSLDIRETAYGRNHLAVATVLNNQGELLTRKMDYEGAKRLFDRSLAIRESAQQPDHPDVAQSLNNLAVLFATQGKYEQAEPLYRRSLAIREGCLAPQHTDVIQSLDNLAKTLEAQENYREAAQLMIKAFNIRMEGLISIHAEGL